LKKSTIIFRSTVSYLRVVSSAYRRRCASGGKMTTRRQSVRSRGSSMRQEQQQLLMLGAGRVYEAVLATYVPVNTVAQLRHNLQPGSAAQCQWIVLHRRVRIDDCLPQRLHRPRISTRRVPTAPVANGLLIFHPLTSRQSLSLIFAKFCVPKICYCSVMSVSHDVGM